MVDVYKIQRRKSFFNKNATFLLLCINVLCFVVFSALIYFNSTFMDYIALKPANIINGLFIWTFLTSMFMHGGLFHLFANMLSLLFLGGFVEKILGKKRFISLYLISGLFAGIFFVVSSLFFVSDFNAYAVGASGALFALTGLLMLLTPNLPVYIMFIPIPIKMKYAAPAMLILLWVVSLLGDIRVGNMAHLGGFLVGIIYAVYLKSKYKNKTQYLSKYFS